MTIHADDISGREFVVTSEGYDREEVRSFLEVVASTQQALLDEIAQLRAERAGEGEIGMSVAAVLETARRSADETTKSASQEAESTIERAEAEADRLRREVTEATDKLREEADLYAFETRANADGEARARLTEVSERIENLLGGAERVRDRLYGIDAILSSVRTEVSQAAASLDPDPIEVTETESPDVIDLRDAVEERVAAETSA